jgi:hypothetical protein
VSGVLPTPNALPKLSTASASILSRSAGVAEASLGSSLGKTRVMPRPSITRRCRAALCRIWISDWTIWSVVEIAPRAASPSSGS